MGSSHFQVDLCHCLAYTWCRRYNSNNLERQLVSADQLSPGKILTFFFGSEKLLILPQRSSLSSECRHYNGYLTRGRAEGRRGLHAGPGTSPRVFQCRARALRSPASMQQPEHPQGGRRGRLGARGGEHGALVSLVKEHEGKVRTWQLACCTGAPWKACTQGDTCPHLKAETTKLSGRTGGGVRAVSGGSKPHLEHVTPPPHRGPKRRRGDRRHRGLRALLPALSGRRSLSALLPAYHVAWPVLASESQLARSVPHGGC